MQVKAPLAIVSFVVHPFHFGMDISLRFPCVVHHQVVYSLFFPLVLFCCASLWCTCGAQQQLIILVIISWKLLIFSFPHAFLQHKYECFEPSCSYVMHRFCLGFYGFPLCALWSGFFYFLPPSFVLLCKFVVCAWCAHNNIVVVLRWLVDGI